MSDSALNVIFQYGTRAERTGFTPDPAVGSQLLYEFYETDHAPALWVWNGAAWVQINAATGVATVTDDGNDVVTVDNGDPMNPVIGFAGVFVDGSSITGSGTSGSPLVSHSSGGAVDSVTSDNDVVTVDNGDPVNPVVQFAGVHVDGATITGDGTTGSPLVGAPDVSGLTFVTVDDESASLPNARQILAGTGITLDVTTPNELTINSSGGGAAIDTGTYAAIPSPSTDSGDLYLPNDGASAYRSDGTKWVPWGLLFPFTEPINGDFAWVNQGGASVDASRGGIYLEGPASTSNWRIRVKAIPAAPYTVDIAFIANALSLNYQLAGMVLRESGTGKLVTFTMEYCLSATGQFEICFSDIHKYSNPTTSAGAYSEVQYQGGWGLVFLRIVDDNTNRKFYLSKDGEHFQLMFSVGRTDFITPDQIGFAVNETTGTNPVGMNLRSWKES